VDRKHFYDCPELPDMTHAFFMTLGTLAGVIAGLAVFVAAAQIVLKLFVSPTFWGIAACLIAICTLLTIWDGHQREIYLHGVEYKHEKVKEAEAWHQLQEQHDARLCKSQAET
jgi:uncharacterized protein Usg